MNMFRTAAVTAATAVLTVASLSAATAAPAPTPAPAPKFLAAKELPASQTPWTASKVKEGVADDFCTEKIAPKSSSTYRTFRTELDTGAHQTVTVAATGAKAKALVGKLRSSVEDCLGKLKKEYPGLKGTSRYQGKVSVEEGAYVYSIDTADPKSGSDDIRLYSVGRDGRTVTVVGWGRLGDLDGVPLKGFKKTTRTAVAKLR
ncbi:hypothetical protein [Streptomyces katsurahamanus]|uniref:Uncharacterized protein n=1 Tax=Streptomyces katsurahamanus TaxID=2577098 RepID=A0ABW9NRQ3_9ACTN|nr:hypothetical protein [Streptomyces katsurahamanus]MQS35956.1 hypothetical protein [Streptomyces katsurahamanus]